MEEVPQLPWNSWEPICHPWPTHLQLRLLFLCGQFYQSLQVDLNLRSGWMVLCGNHKQGSEGPEEPLLKGSSSSSTPNSYLPHSVFSLILLRTLLQFSTQPPFTKCL